MSGLGVLADKYWQDHELERKLCCNELRRSVVDNDDYWGHDSRELDFEIGWDRSRLDALVQADEVIQSAQSDIDPIICFHIAANAISRNLSHLPDSYVSGVIYGRGMVTVDIEGLLRRTFSRAGILETISEGEE